MTYLSELIKTLKLANYLNEQGVLFPFVWHLKKFEENQRYPFELKDKRVALLAVLKALGARSDIPPTKLLPLAQQIVEEMWEEPEQPLWQKKPTKESDKMAEEHLKKVVEELEKAGQSQQ